MDIQKIELKQDEFLLLKDFIKKECGIVVSEEKAYLIESRLVRLVLEFDCLSYKELYLKAKEDSTNKLKARMIDAMTTNETLWFRDAKPWTILREVVIPKYMDELRAKRKGRVVVWSAAAATGQEAYSFAMLLDEALKKEPSVSKEQFVIFATDISASALYMALSGRYNHIVMSRGMLPGYTEKYFTESNGIFEISQTIKEMVTFKQFNLQNSFNIIPTCDLIFCRNVFIYFSEELKRDLYKKMYDRLAPDGHFFLGATESMMGYSDDFEQLEYQKSVYYKPKK